jgi:hypothetical protein
MPEKGEIPIIKVALQQRRRLFFERFNWELIKKKSKYW